MMFKLSFCVCMSFTIASCVSQKNLTTEEFLITGVYKNFNDKERIIFNNNGTFFLIRNGVQKSDVIIPTCDTMAFGIWERRSGFVQLKNVANFDKVYYNISETETASKDSMYFKVIFPSEDALNYKCFKFSIQTSPMYGKYHESNSPEFAISKKGYISSFNLTVKNISPNCELGKKCYQRIYFKVFEGYTPVNQNANYFTINLNNFTQCFYEAFDLDGEIMGIDGKNLAWRGSVYYKIN